jgi:lysozyme
MAPRSVRFYFACSVLLAGCFGSSPYPAARAADAIPEKESDWTELTDDASRADLFKEKIIPARLAEEEAGPEAMLPLAIPKIFVFPDDARYDTILDKPRKNSIFCIDISHYTDAKIHLEELKMQRARCVYVKATQGVRGKDGKFADFWGRLDGLPELGRGAYHFLSSSAPGRDQADAFVNYVNLHGRFKGADLPPVVDLEWDVAKGVPDQWVGKGADYIIRNTLDCLRRIEERTGRKPIIYTATSWFGPKTIPLSRFSELKDYPIWIADYNNKRKLSEQPALPPGVKQILWQFTDGALVTTGYDGKLDASIFYGTDADFKKTFGLPN